MTLTADTPAATSTTTRQATEGISWEDADYCTSCSHAPGCECPHWCTPAGNESKD